MDKKRRDARLWLAAALALGAAFPGALRAAGRGTSGSTGAANAETGKNGGQNSSQNSNNMNQGDGGPNGGDPNGGDQNGGGSGGGGSNDGRPSGGDQGGGLGPGGDRDGARPNADPNEPRYDPAEDDARHPDPELSLDDARDDFTTIVQNFLLKSSRGGAWTYEDPQGRKRRLKLVKVDAPSVVHVNGRRFAGLVRLRDAAAKKTMKLLFTVDLSGEHWKVVSFAEPRAAAKDPAGP